MTLRVLTPDEQAVVLRQAIATSEEAARHLRNRVSTGAALSHAVRLEQDAAALGHVLGNITRKKETSS